jgi:hypothetical protein
VSTTDHLPDSGRRSGRLTDSISIGVLSRVVHRTLVDEVLLETGRKEKRVRLLPAHVVVYFVMAMAVFQDGYEEVMRRLVGGLRFLRAWREEWVVPTTGAICQARQRPGLMRSQGARPSSWIAWSGCDR